MVDNLNRKLTLIFGFLAVAVIALLLLPFRLGLDLQGGTRLTYTVDLDAARAAKQIPASQTDAQAIGEVISIWRERLDPDGVRDVKLRKSGAQRIIVELPGNLSLVAQRATSALKEPFDHQSDTTLQLDAAVTDGDFPTGGRVMIDGELLVYERRGATSLKGISFADGSTAKSFPAGATVTLEASDPWRALIENTGRLEVMMHAGTLDAAGTYDLAVETDKAREWAVANPVAKITEYNNKLITENPGQPLSRLRFFPMREEGAMDRARGRADGYRHRQRDRHRSDTQRPALQRRHHHGWPIWLQAGPGQRTRPGH